MNFSKGYIEPSTAPQPRMDFFDPIFHDSASCDFLTLLSREKTPPHEATPLPPCPFPAFNSTRNFSMHIYRYLTYSMSDTVSEILYVTYSTVYTPNWPKTAVTEIGPRDLICIQTSKWPKYFPPFVSSHFGV